MHLSHECPQIQKQGKGEQRFLQVTPQNLVDTLRQIDDAEVKFSATANSNDLWMSIALSNREQEAALVLIVQALLGKRYTPFRHAIIENHECPINS